MRSVAAGLNLADGLRITGPQARVATNATAVARGQQAGFGALGDQCPLELGDGPQHLQREHTLWGGGVDRIA
jgi:hypothetical protein